METKSACGLTVCRAAASITTQPRYEVKKCRLPIWASVVQLSRPPHRALPGVSTPSPRPPEVQCWLSCWGRPPWRRFRQAPPRRGLTAAGPRHPAAATALKAGGRAAVRPGHPAAGNGDQAGEQSGGQTETPGGGDGGSGAEGGGESGGRTEASGGEDGGAGGSGAESGGESGGRTEASGGEDGGAGGSGDQAGEQSGGRTETSGGGNSEAGGQTEASGGGDGGDGGSGAEGGGESGGRTEASGGGNGGAGGGSAEGGGESGGQAETSGGGDGGDGGSSAEGGGQSSGQGGGESGGRTETSGGEGGGQSGGQVETSGGENGGAGDQGGGESGGQAETSGGGDGGDGGNGAEGGGQSSGQGGGESGGRTETSGGGNSEAGGQTEASGGGDGGGQSGGRTETPGDENGGAGGSGAEGGGQSGGQTGTSGGGNGRAGGDGDGAGGGSSGQPSSTQPAEPERPPAPPPYFPVVAGGYTFTQNQDIGAEILPEAAGGAGGFRYSLSPALPEGLSFDPATRALTGAPAAGGQYSMTYTAVDADGARADWSFTIEILRAAEAQEQQPPDKPEEPRVERLRTSTAGETGLTVTWTAPDDNGSPIIEYQVRYQEQGGGWNSLDISTADTSVEITGLDTGTTYDVSVRANNAGGFGPWSEPGSAMTNRPPVLAEDPASRSVDENTAAATDIGAPIAAADADSDALTYTLSGDDAEHFTLDPASGRLRTRSPLDFETRNTYDALTVTVDDGHGDTDTAALAVTVINVLEPPGKPDAPTVTGLNPVNLRVTWTPPSNTGPPISDYDVQYRVEGASNWTAHPVSGTDTSATLTGLTPGATYEAQVRARNDEGDSPWSASGTGSTEAGPGNTPDNTPPDFVDPDDPDTPLTTATREVAENAPAGANVGAPVTVGASDGKDDQDNADPAVDATIEVTINLIDAGPPAKPDAPTVTASSSDPHDHSGGKLDGPGQRRAAHHRL